MSKKQELPNMTERCRICLIDNGCMTSLHNENVETKLKDLTKCTCIDIKLEENLSSIICHVCLYKLNMWTEFKEQFIQSNKILLEQLELSEASDNAIRDSKKDKLSTKNAKKRKHLNKSGEDSISEIDKKKSKADVSSSELASVDCITGHIILDTISISDDEPNLSKDFSLEVLENPDNDKLKKDAEKCTEEHTEGKSSSGPMRARLLPMKRGRNIERRKASTKRWVERKKALLAATGENVSDTDSIASDEAQLSPVQKARAKTNADKEAERQKRIAKVLKNLETNLADKYIGLRDGDTDSDARRTRLSKELHSSTLQKTNNNSSLNQADKKNEKNKSSLARCSMEKENSLIPSARKNVTADGAKKTESQIDEGIPNSLKSELVVGDTTYAVTSTLMLVDSSHLNKEGLNNVTKDSKSLNVDENSHEKNTDIIDAVQLRRVTPVASNTDNKSKSKSIERCLNIEVEGNELSVLKRVQVQLADFVQKEMKQKLFGTNDDIAKTDKTDNSANTCQKLDQKLKNIIEKAIKKNIESSVMRDIDDGQKVIRISPAKTAVTSSKYQPKVMMKRLNIAKESKLYNINNVHVLKQARLRSQLAGPFSWTLRKRQSVPPIRYNDYNTSALESDSEEWDDATVKKPPKATNSGTQGNLATKPSSGANSQIVIAKRMENDSTIKPIDNGAALLSPGTSICPSDSTNEQKADYEDAIRIEGAIAENHICGVCGLTFNTRKDVEAHVRTHKPVASIPLSRSVSRNEDSTTPSRQVKQKMMRCKRCHEIVEARFVKAHVCKTTETHKCYVCNSMFRTEKLLVRHLESHDQSEFNITNAVGGKKSGNVDASQKTQSATPQKDQEQTATQNILTDKNDIQSDKITSTGVKLDNAENIEKPKETYTCFVCDKIFTDEEVLKDHLQKHCDDLSEGEQSNSKEQYQCAICGDTLESDQALEEHVGKHLFDDEDDNPNLISINQDNKNNNSNKQIEMYHCGQCLEVFNSEVLLEMHMQAHEEDIAIAEWEKQGMKVYQYQCVLCDELFDAEKELAEHLDVHNANAQVCQLCDKPFRTLEDLQEHVATH